MMKNNSDWSIRQHKYKAKTIESYVLRKKQLNK